MRKDKGSFPPARQGKKGRDGSRASATNEKEKEMRCSVEGKKEAGDCSMPAAEKTTAAMGQSLGGPSDQPPSKKKEEV